VRRVSVRVSRAEAETARARLLELVPEGFEEATTDDGVVLTPYVDASREARVREVFAASTSEAVVPGWEEAWKRFHRPVRIGPLWVGPPWERPEPGAVAVVVDPGRAFGTGAQATTRLCLEFLVEVERGSLVDLGCGSGVLAIAAAGVGFAPVVALDVDPAALAAARANAAANAVAVEVRRADVLADPLPRVDVAVANIGVDALAPLAARVQARALVASGYLATDVSSTPGWRRVERREADGWAADLFEPS
jgi:ribosomal protein L11 methyltransferase